MVSFEILADGLFWESESSSTITITDKKPTIPAHCTRFGKRMLDAKFRNQIKIQNLEGFRVLHNYLRLGFPKRHGFRWATSQSNTTICFVVANKNETFYLIVNVVES